MVLENLKNLPHLYHDPEHWKTLSYPLRPSVENVKVIESNCIGTVLLLGSTAELLEICDDALDLCNLYNNSKVKIKDWTTNTNFYDTIIIDGGLNLNSGLTDDVLTMSSMYSKRLIARVFNKKLFGMKYATYFPKQFEFSIIPETVLYESDSYNIYMWCFYENIY